MDIIFKIRQKASQKKKTILLPEYNDNRVIEASNIISSQGIAKGILLSPDKVDKNDRDRYIQQYYDLRRSKGVELEQVKKMFDDPLFSAAMMVREGKADGFVAGANHTTADTARAAIHCLGLDERYTIATSCFIMSIPDCPFGSNGNFIYADCGVIPEPNARQLACIAILSAELGGKVLDFTPRVALLSYSTKGSAKGKGIDKIAEALKIIKEMVPELLVDGEMQVDAAIIPQVGKIKCPQSSVAGQANVLVFPDLEAGNIGYKLTERLAKGRALGPLLLGLKKPSSDLSRGCSIDDVVDCAAVTAIRAQ
ncbi:MAG: phosphate acetyltransferase [Candidatus Omnitrophota bacterium]